MQATGTERTGPRIALYSHDTMGLGHVRRNLLIARSLIAPPLQADVLLISGIREAGAFAMPSGIDCLTLPAYQKKPDGRYAPRALGCHIDTLIALRSAAIRVALKRFDPDLLVVDNVPTGALSELTPTLRGLARHRRTRCVLGLRDVLDEPSAVRRQWWKQRNYEAVHRYFDSVWVYGDQDVLDIAEAYGFDHAIRDKLHYTGYLDQSSRLAAAHVDDPAIAAIVSSAEPYVLCAVGGGQDGARLATLFAEAEPPPGHRSVIVTGPFMPADARERLKQAVLRRPHLVVLEFVSEPIHLVRGAARVVTMGGYNTVTEILSLGKRALIVPRVRQRTEQLIRAELLAHRGLVELVHPDAVSREQLTAWLRAESPAPTAVRTQIDLGGLTRLPELVREQMAERARPRPTRPYSTTRLSEEPSDAIA